MMNDRTLNMLDRVLDIVEVVSTDINKLESKLNETGYLNITEVEQLKMLRVKFNTLKEVMGMEVKR